MINFLKEHQLVTVPDYLGRFEIRQLPEAFKPTSPGGFMNPPGVYNKDPSGFFFIPTYNPESKNFYIRAAIEDPRPMLRHEGIPGHFMQLSIANHLTNEIRRQHGDGVFVEGWALYGEEMLMRTGLYPDNSPAQDLSLRWRIVGIKTGPHQHFLAVEGPAFHKNSVAMLPPDFIRQMVRDRELHEVAGNSFMTKHRSRIFNRRANVKVLRLRIVGRNEIETGRIFVINTGRIHEAAGTRRLERFGELPDLEPA